MKKVLFLSLALGLAIYSEAQTQQVAHKSHSGSDENFETGSNDGNFGWVEPPKRITKVKLLKNNCIVEVFEGRWHQSDTVCDHPYFTGQYTLDEIKAFYPKEVEFIGFEGHFFNKAVPPPAQKRNSPYFLILLLFIGGASVAVLKPAR